MGQNSDTYNIFGSYFNSVLLKEQTGQPASNEDMKNYKSTAVKPDEVVGKTTPLTPEERAYADAAKAKGKKLTDTQARLMFANEKRVKEAPATQAQAQPAAQEQSDDEIIASIRAELKKYQQTK
jgi:cell pole-organizing protein PopZ